MKPIPFFQQYGICKKEKMVGDGPFLSFEDHPENLPFLPNKKVLKAIKEGTWKGIQLSACLRFGGECNSKNLECMKLRNVPLDVFDGKP